MSSQSAPAVPAATGHPPASTGPARASIVALILAVGAVTVAAAVLWQPWGERNGFNYATLAPVRDAAWAGTVIDGLGIAAAGIGLGLAACLLARARGAIWANVGAVLTGLGAVLFSGAMISLGTLAWYATATEAISPEAGTALIAYIDENATRTGVVHMAGFLLFTLGSLALMVALWRSRSVPRWLPLGYAALTVTTFAVPGRALDVVQAVQMLSLVVVAWCLWRAARAEGAGVAAG